MGDIVVTIAEIFTRLKWLIMRPFLHFNGNVYQSRWSYESRSHRPNYICPRCFNNKSKICYLTEWKSKISEGFFVDGYECVCCGLFWSFSSDGTHFTEVKHVVSQICKYHEDQDRYLKRGEYYNERPNGK